MRNMFSDTFYALAREDDRLAIVVSDISPVGSMSKFREEFPSRFVNTGVAEQVMIGLAAGLAQRGFRPFAYSIATFALYRPFEMIRDDLCYQDLPVTVVGIGGGVTYSTLGGTHHAMEDVAIAAAIPNMQVIAPCDPAEAREATRYLARHSAGPAYLRLGKAGEPDLTTNAAEPFTFGKVRLLRRGKDVCILSYGVTVAMALQVADRLKVERGIDASVAAVHCLKPLDVDGIARLLESHGSVVVMEEHVPHGGLGSRVKEIAWDSGARCRLQAFSLQDRFIHCYGSHEELLAAHGLGVEAILAKLP